MSGISIGKAIYSLLSQSQELEGLLGEKKIFPLIVNSDTRLPFIVYKRLSSNPYFSKDYYSETEVQFAIVTEKYSEGIDIAELVNTVILQSKGNTYNGMTIDKVEQTSVEESFYEDAFTQVLTYKFITH